MLAFLMFSGLSNRQFSFPFLSISLHHLKPTSSLPVTFLTTQKSRELRRMTKMKVMMLESMKVPMTR
jgi:hypothetical protein